MSKVRLNERIRFWLRLQYLVARQRFREWRARKEVKTYFYLDNNLLGAIASSPERYRRGNDDLFRLGLVSEELTPHYWPTYFSWLEYVGVAVPQVDPRIEMPQRLINAGNEYDICLFVGEEAKKFYRAQEELTAENLRQRALDQSGHFPEETRHLYDTIVMPWLGIAGFPGQMLDYLGLDYVLKYDYPNPIRRKMGVALPQYFFGSLHELRDFPAGRFLKRDWDLLYSLQIKKINKDKALTREQKVAARAEWQTISRSIDLKTRADFIDCEMLTALVTGHVVEGRRVPIHAFTCDPRRKVEDRLAIFRAILRMHAENYMEKLKMPDPFPDALLRPGTVHFCNQNTGEIESSLNVLDATTVR